jgi:hypothetical protein
MSRYRNELRIAVMVDTSGCDLGEQRSRPAMGAAI